MDNSVITDNRIEFDSYEEFIDFCNNLNSDMDLILLEDLPAMLENLTTTEEFTRKQKRDFLASDLKQDDIKEITLYKNRLFVKFENVDYCEPEYAKNDITDLNVVYYFETKTWHFAY